MRQAMILAMGLDRKAALVAPRIGLVVADHQSGLGAKGGQQRPRQPGVAVPQHAGVPRPREAVDRRGEAVHRDQRRRPAGAAPRPSRPRRRGIARPAWSAINKARLRPAGLTIAKGGGSPGPSRSPGPGRSPESGSSGAPADMTGISANRRAAGKAALARDILR